MKKSLLTLLCALPIGLWAISASAQMPVAGITAGAAMSSVRLDGLSELQTDFKSLRGIEGGLYLNFIGPGFYVRPAAIAGFYRSTVQSQEAEGAQVTSDFSLSTLEVPVLGGFVILPMVTLEAGPSWTYLMGYTDSINGVSLDLNRHSLGYRAGVRIAFARLGVYGHYCGNITTGGSKQYSLEQPSKISFGITYDLTGQ